MRYFVRIFPLFLAFAASAQSGAPATDPWRALAFLQGTWEAKTAGGAAGAKGTGSYTFRTELKNHVLARHRTTSAGCKGPADFDCDHSDLLYIYQDATGQPLKAIYFDNEGHVIHYDVSTPDATTAIFISESARPGPQFRLMYELKSGVMWGKFQIRMPDQAGWQSYLEWSGSKRSES
ncbi:MAG: hypothetical protein WCC04_07520 [Terriglobales bacterium]